MNAIHRDIFQAIHEGKWLSIEYRNKQEEVTKYWIGIRDLNVKNQSLSADGLHLGKYVLKHFNCIYIDSILSAQIVEGSYCPVNDKLVQDIYENPHKYKSLFDHSANLKILNYLEDCNRMDVTPYKTEFSLIRQLDLDSFHADTARGGIYSLSDEQFRHIVRDFQVRTEKKEASAPHPKGKLVIQQLAMNVMSLHTPKGLYVLAYRKLGLDVKQHCLRPDEDITVCTEFTIDGVKESVRRFLDGDDYELLQDFENNQELIKDAIGKYAKTRTSVDDMPYVIGLGMKIPLDLHQEYGAILQMFQKNQVHVPIRAFFGDLLERPRGERTAPMALINRQVNLDQLLAIHNAMKYPVSYVQGPPGTGKTNTILNTIVTAFFNGRTVLFSSYNNHPIDGVADKLTSMTYMGKPIPFPLIRLGNREKVREALIRIRNLYEQVGEIKVYGSTLDRNKDERIRRTRELTELLKRHDSWLELEKRREAIGRLLDYQHQHASSMQMMSFEADLSGRQLKQVERQIERIGTITEADAKALLPEDEEELRKYLYYTSAKYIQRIGEPQNQALKELLELEDADAQIEAFQEYLSDDENLHRFLQIFPIVATTCISAHRLGDPGVHFDMTIMDEASQCNTAVSLVPILRGRTLMLVGDPQQLNPVILLDGVTNQKLRRKYMVTEEYDYRKHSIYKTFLACDAVSDEVLLRNHYRCHEKIIGFNNKKYYHSKLVIHSESKEQQPLQYIDVPDGRTDCKNTSPAEVEAIADYAALHQDKTIGVITPFVNQKLAIEKRLKQEGLHQVTCGTIHAFQGDEKDVVLFSTALTDQTYTGTYGWLKNNQELINVATSRAREQLIILSNTRNLERLHNQEEDDDLYDLIQYVRSNGSSKVIPKQAHSRALGVKPFSTETEEAFLATLNHALGNLWLTQNRFSVEKEVAVSQVFEDNVTCSDLFYSGRFDFVLYEESGLRKFPVLVIELDGKEHFENDIVKARDKKKQEICKAHNLELIRVENSYARRYQYVKEILRRYFGVRH